MKSLTNFSEFSPAFFQAIRELTDCFVCFNAATNIFLFVAFQRRGLAPFVKIVPGESPWSLMERLTSERGENGKDIKNRTTTTTIIIEDESHIKGPSGERGLMGS